MSDTRFLNFKTPIKLSDWLDFCKKYGIEYSPQTTGRNVFYKGGMGGAEICFGRPDWSDLPKLPNGRLDFGAASPREEATDITVSSSYGANINTVARAIRKHFKATAAAQASDQE